MAALTKTQLDHAQKRIKEAMEKYIARKIAPLGKKPEEVEFTDDEKIKMIRAGTAKVKKDQNYDRYGGLYAFFDYPLTSEMMANAAAAAGWEKAVDKVRSTAHVVKERLLDELIMAPDGAAALARIATAFED